MSTPGFTAEASLYKTSPTYRAVNKTAHASDALYRAQFSFFSTRPHCLWHQEETFIIDPVGHLKKITYWICT
jgi:hypothetical protein